jgi:hypothetical protein
MTGISGNTDHARADDDGMASMAFAEPAIRSVPARERDALQAVRAVVENLSPGALGALISLANARLPDGDPRKIRLAEVRSLRRLASQAHELDASLIGHAEDRRRVGEQRGDVAPEAANTALWTDRLIRALEGIVRRYE